MLKLVVQSKLVHAGRVFLCKLGSLFVKEEDVPQLWKTSQDCVEKLDCKIQVEFKIANLAVLDHKGQGLTIWCAQTINRSLQLIQLLTWKNFR